MPNSSKDLGSQNAFEFATETNPTEVLLELKQAIARAISKSRKSREALADYLDDISGKLVTVAMINDWTAESKQHVPPPQYILPICTFCKDLRPLAVLLKPYSLIAIGREEQLLLQHGELFVQEADLKARQDKLSSDVRRMFFSGKSKK